MIELNPDKFLIKDQGLINECYMAINGEVVIVTGVFPSLRDDLGSIKACCIQQGMTFGIMENHRKIPTYFIVRVVEPDYELNTKFGKYIISDRINNIGESRNIITNISSWKVRVHSWWIRGELVYSSEVKIQL